VDQGEATLAVEDRAPAQPGQEVVAVGSIQDLRQRIAPLPPLDTGGEPQQVQVVVAEDGHQGLPDRIQEAQGFQRLGAAVDQVAQEIRAVARGRKADLGEQALQGVAAALQVTDEVVHAALSPPQRIDSDTLYRLFG